MNRLWNRDSWNEILESITSNGFRTFITAFGVFWGIFILVLLLAAASGLENGVTRGFSSVATNSAFFWTQGVSKEYKGLPKGRQFDFKINDAEALRKNIKGLKIVSPRNRLGGFGGSNSVVHGLNAGSFSVYADYPEILTQQSMNVTKGRFINYSDIEKKRKIAIIGSGVVADLYEKDEEVIGSQIKIQGVNFMVVGIYRNSSTNGNGIEKQKEIFVPFTTYSQAFNSGDQVGFFAITADDDKSITDIKESILVELRKRHSIHPEDDRAIGNFDLFEIFNKVTGLFIALKFVAYFVGFLVLISGIIGISNIMLIVIKERTKEIGVRRALGATPRNIRSQILTESLFLTIISGMAGVAFATFIIFLVNLALDKVNDPETMFVNPSIDIATVGMALFILIICGLLAGLIPAQTAIKIKPIEALRTE